MATAAPRVETISIHNKLMIRGVKAIGLNYILVFATISLAPSNLDADSIVPAGRQFRRRYWPPDPRPTIRIGGKGRGLSIEPLFATNAKE